MTFLKYFERVGRNCLALILTRLFAKKQHPITVINTARILVVRLDERVGNAVMLSPLLLSLRQRFPHTTIDVLISQSVADLLSGQDYLNNVVVFNKKAFFGRNSPIGILIRLRKRPYDLIVNTDNPTDPSLTHAVFVCLVAGAQRIGFSHEVYGRIYNATAEISETTVHEIDMRLALLDLLPGHYKHSLPSIKFPGPVTNSPTYKLIESLQNMLWAIIYFGSRKPKKILSIHEYTAVAKLLLENSIIPVFTFGKNERKLAEQACQMTPQSIIAPDTNLLELGYLMSQARFVIACDTGPMHLAVAAGTPTCGLFIATDVKRFGYTTPPHIAINFTEQPEHSLHAVSAWIKTIIE